MVGSMISTLAAEIKKHWALNPKHSLTCIASRSGGPLIFPRRSFSTGMYRIVQAWGPGLL
jgi:hypothetical protein